MTTLPHDLGLALRRLGTSPGFTAVAVLTLALGIGANTAIFSIVYGVLLRPLGVADPERLAVLTLHRQEIAADAMGFWPAHLDELRAKTEGRAGLARLASYLFDSVTLEGEGAAEEVGTSLMVDGRFFEVLGVEPILGRALGPADVVAGRRGDACVLGEAFWRRRFGADPEVLGRVLVLDGRPVEVVGVMPGGVPLPQVGVELWLPQGWDVEDPALYGRLGVLARLEPAARWPAAAEALAAAAAQLSERFPRLAGYTVTPQPFQESLVGGARPVILAVAGGVGLLLLLACANTASLLLARAATRQREMATRRALGARRRQVASQLLTESLLLALLGGAAGVALAFALHRLLLGLAEGLLPRLHDVRLDLPVLAFAAAVSVLTGLVFGLAPIAYTFSHDLAGALRTAAGTRGGPRIPGSLRARAALIVAQMTLAVLLAVGAALMARSLLHLRAVDPGFASAGVGGARIYLDDGAYGGDSEEALYFDQLLEHLRSQPEIAAAGGSSGLPMDPLTIDYDLPYTVSGDPRGEDASRQAFFRTVTPGYLETMAIPLLRGRPLGGTDRADTEPVALINETFARLAWPGRDPVGESFAIYGGSRRLRVVGVVGDVRFAGPADPERAEFYVHHRQFSFGAMTVVARLAAPALDAGRAAEAIAGEALALDPHQPVHSTFTLEALERGAVASPRFVTLLLGSFTAVALLLAAAGLFGVLSGWVAERRRELGVRMALGANRRDLLALVLWRGLAPAAVGLALGLLGSRWVAAALLPLLFGVEAGDPAVIAAVAAVLIAAALLGTAVPALRAARVQPMRVLRLE